MPLKRLDARAYLGIDTQKFKPSSNRKQLRDKFNIPFDVIVIGSLGRLIPSKECMTY